MSNHAMGRDTSPTPKVHGTKNGASFQVIVLGASGGPCEDTITGMLVRSAQTEWRKGSLIAVDAGAHLASIIRILQQHMPLHSRDVPPPGYTKEMEDGPFAGIQFPNYSAKANGLYVFRELMHAFLITHPHLDHLSAMGVNTPALEYGREAKTIVALDSTIEAIKSHIFNDWIWPNLSDEGSGAGFVTYRRLWAGGNPRLGSGEGRGYIRVCDGLSAKAMPVTHGKCRKRPPTATHQRNESAGWNEGYAFPARRLSRISDHDSYFSAMAHQHAYNNNPATAPQAQMAGPSTPGHPAVQTPNLPMDPDHLFEAVSSSAFFIRNEESGQEVLIFGDTEPDAVSMHPQNFKIWKEAASKVATGAIKAIFIECSYDDTVRDEDLYGHLCPRHLVHELFVLGRYVAEVRHRLEAAADGVPDPPAFVLKEPRESIGQSEGSRKRRRVNGDTSSAAQEDTTPDSPSVSPYVGTRSGYSTRRKASHGTAAAEKSPVLRKALSPTRNAKHVQFQGPARATPDMPPTALPGLPFTLSSGPNPPLINTLDITRLPPNKTEQTEKLAEPLKGLTVHIIHVKDTLLDGPSPAEIITGQLETQAAEFGLGCAFDVTECGEAIWI